jgi:hypothetical protein
VTDDAPPPGYRRARAGHALLVARDDLFDELAAAIRRAPTLHDWAATHPQRRSMVGRGPVHAVPLPTSGTRIVVRRNRHGGLLAPLTGERFLPPTNAPAELAIARRLAAAGVNTVDVLGYAVYGEGLFRTADVVSAEIAGDDLGALVQDDAPDRRRAGWIATGALLDALLRAGARHPDLNVKNVLLAPPSPVRAVVLDVDRVRFGRPADPSVATANAARLARSLRKWARLRGVTVERDELPPAVAERL